MNLTLGLRALAVLAFVAASTTVILKPQLIGGAESSHSVTKYAVVALNHG
jgi:hypothetical protein